MIEKRSEIFDIQRKSVAYMTALSWREIPHVSYIYEPDITEFYNEFKALSQSGRKLTFNTIMLKVICECLKAAPKLNSHVEYHRFSATGVLHIEKNINIALPWTLGDGKMITPVLFSAENMSLDDISAYISNIAKKLEKTDINEVFYRAALKRKLDELLHFKPSALISVLFSVISKHKVKRLSGDEKKVYYAIPENDRLTENDIMNATVTVSNIGSLYKEQKGYFSLLEIVSPHSFVVGISAILEKPGVYIDENGIKQIGVRKYLPMCLAFDHRAFDFSALLPFIKKADQIFSNSKIIYDW